MEGTVKTPFGPMKKTTALVAGGGVVILLAIAYFRHKKSAASTAASPAAVPASTPVSSDPYPADGTVGNPSDPYSTDPATGMTYGDEQAGYGGGYGYGGGGGGTSGGGGGNPPGFTTNGQWAQAAETAMGSNGNDAIAAALGHYLTGQPVTTDQQTIIEEAIAIENYPPVNGPNGFPPSIDLQSGGGSATNPVTGLQASPGFTGIDVSWTASPGATSYTVTAPGASNSPAQVTSGTSVRMRNNKPGTKVTITVLANPAASGAQPASITVTTK